jgi:hypothetical protein
MNEFFNNIKNIIIMVLVVIIILMQQCSGPSIDFNLFGKKDTPIEGTVITKIETKWDTVSVDSIVYVPKYVTKTITEHDTVPADIDTLSILKDYYTKYFYSDIIDLDSLGTITIDDTISKNSIIWRKVKPSLYIPTTTITRDSLISKNEFYYGFGLAGNREQFSYVGGELLYRSKRKKIIGAGIGINQNLQPNVSFRMMWKIGK